MNLENKTKEFDADFSHENPINQEAAESQGLTYYPKEKVYIGSDGCKIKDEYGQPIG